MIGGQTLEMENILVYYVDEDPPTFTMKNLSAGIIAVIVVVVLAVVAGLLVLVSFILIFTRSIYSVFIKLYVCLFIYFLSFCAVLCQKETESEVQQSPGELNFQ